jgi:tRNA (guanine10-N2)-methyltransferase
MWEHHIEKTTFRFQSSAYNHSIPESRKMEIIQSFAYMDWKGQINMKNPEVVLTYIEECQSVYMLGKKTFLSTDIDPVKEAKTWRKYENDGKFLHAYFGRQVLSLLTACSRKN